MAPASCAPACRRAAGTPRRGEVALGPAGSGAHARARSSRSSSHHDDHGGAEVCGRRRGIVPGACGPGRPPWGAPPSPPVPIRELRRGAVSPMRETVPCLHRAARRHELGVLGRVLPAGQRGLARAARRPALRRLPAALGRLHRRSRCSSAAATGTRPARSSPGGQALEAAGAELLVLCTNTMHKVADAITGGDRHPVRAHRRHHRRRGPRRRARPPSACSRPRTRWSRTSTSAACATATASRFTPARTTARSCTTSSTRSSASASSRTLARPVPADHGRPRRPRRRGDPPAAPRSTCWSARRTRPCRCSTRPACTPSGGRARARGISTVRSMPLARSRSLHRLHRRRPRPAPRLAGAHVVGVSAFLGRPRRAGRRRTRRRARVRHVRRASVRADGRRRRPRCTPGNHLHLLAEAALGGSASTSSARSRWRSTRRRAPARRGRGLAPGATAQIEARAQAAATVPSARSRSTGPVIRECSA